MTVILEHSFLWALNVIPYVAMGVKPLGFILSTMILFGVISYSIKRVKGNYYETPVSVVTKKNVEITFSIIITLVALIDIVIMLKAIFKG